MSPYTFDPLAIFTALADESVEYLTIGGIAAAAYGDLHVSDDESSVSGSLWSTAGSARTSPPSTPSWHSKRECSAPRWLNRTEAPRSHVQGPPVRWITLRPRHAAMAGPEISGAGDLPRVNPIEC